MVENFKVFYLHQKTMRIFLDFSVLKNEMNGVIWTSTILFICNSGRKLIVVISLLISIMNQSIRNFLIFLIYNTLQTYNRKQGMLYHATIFLMIGVGLGSISFKSVLTV